MYQFTIHPAVAHEVEHVALYYETQSPTLGRQFMQELDASLMRMAYFPYIYAQVFPPYHRALLHRFPYAVLYRIENKMIYVDGVLPDKANPSSISELLTTRLH